VAQVKIMKRRKLYSASSYIWGRGNKKCFDPSIHLFVHLSICLSVPSP